MILNEILFAVALSLNIARLTVKEIMQYDLYCFARIPSSAKILIGKNSIFT